MFTGIVQALAPIKHIADESGLVRLSVTMTDMTHGLELGASVAVNGTCLTVTGVTGDAVSFDVIPETLRTTNLGALSETSLVNVERSFQIGDEVGGHIVSGHVTGTAELLERRVNGNDHVLRFELAAAWGRFVFHKGFIALDGASLTVSAINREAGWFEVSLIPETLARTTLGQRAQGERVNVEVDSQTVTTVETVERILADPAYRQALAGASG